MSSFKRFCLESESMKRRSYDERICDDLSEVILQYLPLKDKLRLESVSKHFQRTLFVKQYELTFDVLFFKDKRIESKALESVLKKCPNIKSIKLFDLFLGNKNCNQMIRLIIKYCHKLSRIECRLTQMTEKTFQKFVQKFGSKLNYFYVYSSEEIKRLKSFTNIQDLYVGHQNSSEDFSELNFKNLKKIVINFKENDFSLYTLSLRHQSLQHLNITFETEDQIILQSLLDLIPCLNNLVELKVWTKFGLNEEIFSKQLTQIAMKCEKLKSFGCNWIINKDNYKDMPQILSPLKQLTHLKRLEIRLRYTIDHIIDLKNFSFKCFEGFQYITHLNFNISSLSSIHQSVIEGIDKNLPKLQYLIIHKRLDATKWTAYILSRLSRLEVLELDIRERTIRDFIKTQVTENCKKFKSNKISF